MFKFDMKRSNNIIYGRVQYPLNNKGLTNQTIEIKGEDNVNIIFDVSNQHSNIREVDYGNGDLNIVFELSTGKSIASGPLVIVFDTIRDAIRLESFMEYLNQSWRGENMVKIEEKTFRMREIEEEFAKPKGVDLEELFRSMYVDEGMSAENMSKELGIGVATTRRWLDEMNINSRKLDFSGY